MSDPFQRLRWALGPGHDQLNRLYEHRDRVRALIGINAEAKLAEDIADEIKDMSPMTAAEVAIGRLAAETVERLGELMTRATSPVWRQFAQKWRERTADLKRALTATVRDVLDEHEVAENDLWSVEVYGVGEPIPDHVKLLGGRLVRAEGFEVGDHGESLIAIGRQDVADGRVIYCEMQAIPAVALGFGWEDAHPETIPTGQPIEVVDEAEIRADARRATADIDEAIAELK